MDTLEGVFQNGIRLRKAVAVVAHGALEDEAETVRAVVQIVEDLAVGRLAVGDLDALHHRPRRGRRAAGHNVRILRWAIERLDDDAVIALRFERGEGCAFQRLFDQRLPGRLVGGGKVAGQGKFSHIGQSSKWFSVSPSRSPPGKKPVGFSKTPAMGCLGLRLGTRYSTAGKARESGGDGEKKGGSQDAYGKGQG